MFRADTVWAQLQRDAAWLVTESGLPDKTLLPLMRFYLPLAEAIAHRKAQRRGALSVAIQAPQGAGKSTLVRTLQAVLARHAGLRVAALSIDDIYLTRAERRALADRVHPLFITRGVPGTHDPVLGCRVLDGLVQPGQTAIPRFDKGRDDRAPEASWPVVSGPCDVVLFEGLWLGMPPIEEAALREPVNALEENEDPQGVWRRHANACLARDYPPMFDRCELLIHMQVPDFDCVRRWRGGAEAQLRARLLAQGKDTSRVMDAEALARFFAHYERFTAHAMQTLPARADIILRLDRDHRIIDSTLGPCP